MKALGSHFWQQKVEKSSQNTWISAELAAKGEMKKKRCKEESETTYLEPGQMKSS